MGMTRRRSTSHLDPKDGTGDGYDEEPRSRRRRDEDEEDERPTRSRRSRRDEEEEEEDERPKRRRSSARDEEDEDDRPKRRSSRSSRDEEDEDKPARRRTGGTSRRRSSDDEDKPSRRRKGTGGFDSYRQKKRSNSQFADEFKPDTGQPTLIKFLDAEPFDVYNQHWVDEGAASGKTRHSFVCRDDEFFDDEDGCPLCDIGETASTMSLFNVLDLTNPRKPEIVVWKTTPAVTGKLERLAGSDRTSPLDREDLYFEVEMVKTKNKTEWDIKPVKARDLEEDFGIEPFEEDELEDFAEGRFEDRSAITKVDSYDELLELAESLD